MCNEEIITALKDEFMTELYEREYSYEDFAINAIFDEWFKQKTGLIDLLSKHPNWNPAKMMIQFDEDFSREIDIATACEFFVWLSRNTHINNINCEYAVNEYYNYKESLYSTLRYNFINDTYIPERLKDKCDAMNTLAEEFRFRPGMKVTKVIGKICKHYGWDKIKNYNAEYAKFCDAMSPLKVKRHTCISVNPLDYLLMSNGNSWTSCHDIKENSNAGCYSSGTISYMLDRDSIIFYTVSSYFDGEDIELTKKLQRQVFGYHDYQLLQSRLYPQSNDCTGSETYKDIRNIMQKVIADCLGMPNLWVKRHVDNVILGEGATCYPDWSCQASLCSTSVIKGKEADVLDTMVLGAKPICISCGYTHNTDENIDCCQNGNRVECCNCGYIMDEDDAFFFDGDYYCEDCCTRCDCCGAMHPNSDITYLSYRNEGICQDCLEEYYSYCTHCGEYVFDDHITFVDDEDEWICDDCIDADYQKCDDCGNYFHVRNERIKAYQDTETGEVNWYCECCADKYEDGEKTEV